MRVAFLTNFIPPYRISLYEALMEEAGELRVFISTAMESNRQWQPQWGKLDVVQQRTLTLQRKWRTAEFTEDYELHIPYDTLAQLRRWKPDVILTGEMGARSLQAAAFGRMTRTPVVVWAMLSERTEKERGRLRNAARQWLIRNVDGFIVNGESGARYLRRFGVRDDKLLRVNQSLDMKPYLSLAIERQASTATELLHIGSLSERKGVSVMLDGLAVWGAANTDRQVVLTLVGDGPLAAQLKERPMPKNVRLDWIGARPYDELPQWYARGDALIFPSLGDEWGLVVNEALAAGVPVAGSSYAQAVTELIEDGENGWVFKPDSPEAVARVIERVTRTPLDRLQAMRGIARDSIRDLTPENAAARIIARLRELARTS